MASALNRLVQIIGVVSCGFLAAFSTNTLAQKQFITIGTGGVTGVYYPTGGAICRLVNKNSKTNHLRCSVESTGGSVYNINSIRTGDLNVGVTQSDSQYYAIKGVNAFTQQGPFPTLRAVFALHPEIFTVVARKDAHIKTFADVKGKRMNIGVPGSGTRNTMNLVMKELGWTKKDFSLASELKPSEMAKALCDNKIDAFVYVLGHPSGSIKEATTACDSVIVPVSNELVNRLIAGYPFYAKADIPGGIYRSAPQPVPSFGVRATLVSSTKTSDEVIYQLTKAVFENLKRFKKLHPAFANLKAEDMVASGLTAPLHAGALRYYQEAGLLPKTHS